MKNKRKAICALWMICISSIVLAKTLVRSEKYQQLKGQDVDLSFSLVNQGSVQSKLECFRHCNSDDDCRGVGLVQETGEKKALNCFMVKKKSAGQVANQDLAGVRVYVKGNTI